MVSEWEETTILDLIYSGHASLQTGPFGTALKAAEYATEGIPLISVREIRHGYFELTEHTPFVNKKTLERLPKFILHQGDIVFGRKGAVDRSAMIQKSQDGWFLGSDGIRLRLDSYCDHRFISYQVRSPVSQNWLMQHAAGTTMPSMNQEILGRVRLILPHLHEQKAIAHVLGSLDDRIELNRRMTETLEGMAQALFKSCFVDFDPVLDNALVSGKEIPPGLKEKAAARTALGDNRHPLPKEIRTLFPDEFSYSDELGWIPKGWKVSSIDNEFDVTMGQSPPGSTYNEEGEGIPFFQGRADFGFRYPSNRVYCTAPKRFANKGDTLVCVRAPVGDVNMAHGDCCVGRGLSAVRHKSGGRSFTYYSMRELREHFNKFEAEGTVFGSINQKDFKGLPNIKIDRKILASFELQAGSFDEKIEQNSLTILNLSNLRDTLLPKLLPGEIRIPDAQKMVEELG